MLIDYDGTGPREARLSVLTLMLYEQEFGGADMLADVLGRQDVSGGGADDGTVDFSGVRWGALARALWAALKTADDDVPPFAEWAASVEDGLDLPAVNAALGPEMIRKFFRPRSARA